MIIKALNFSVGFLLYQSHLLPNNINFINFIMVPNHYIIANHSPNQTQYLIIIVHMMPTTLIIIYL